MMSILTSIHYVYDVLALKTCVYIDLHVIIHYNPAILPVHLILTKSKHLFKVLQFYLVSVFLKNEKNY